MTGKANKINARKRNAEAPDAVLLRPFKYKNNILKKEKKWKKKDKTCRQSLR